MKRILLAFILSLAFVLGHTQQRVIDSLKQKLVLTKQDTNRVLLLANLCELFRPINQDSLQLYGRQAISLAKAIQFPKGEVDVLAIMGRGQVQSGNLVKALEMELRALRIAEDNNLVAETALPLNYIGVIYYFLNDFSNALHYYKASKSVYELTNDLESIAIENMNIGSAYEDLNQLDSALYFDKLAYDCMSQSKKGINSMLYRNMGEVYIKLGKHHLALDLIRKGLKQSLKRNTRQVTCTSYNSMARVFKNLDQADSSIYFSQKALTEGQAINYKNGILEAALLLSELYEQKDPKTAIKYFKLASITKDSLYGNRIVQAISTITLQERERRIEKENTKKAHQNQLKQYFLLSVLGVFFFIAFILYRNNRKEKEAKNLLQEKNEEINLQRDKAEKALFELKSTQAQLIQSEKLASLGELTAGIAHEIQNPLNFVNNFAEVSAEMLDEMHEELKKGDTTEAIAIATDLKTNLEKINHHGQRASSIVKGMLEHSRAGRDVACNVSTDINALADEYLRLAYHGWRAKDNDFNCKIETHFDLDLPKVSVIPQDIGRVLLNLINNAFYAVAERSRSTVQRRSVETLHATSLQHPEYQPTVSVSTQKTGDQVIIKVQDNGNGIAESIREKIFQPFFTTKPTGQGTGLGLSLAHDIVTKGHRGTLTVDSIEGKGTKFTISLPTLS